jgi:hypothetical protein
MDEQNPPPGSSMNPPNSPSIAPSIANDQVICSLFEGDFHVGVAVLINSVVRAGFKGLFWIGCRGALPSWTRPLKRRDDGLFEVGEALLGFETIEGSRHFGQFKPEFLSRTIDQGIARHFLWYFDPDITVRCAWSFFEMWVRHGVCICQETIMGTMPSRHPIRCEWMRMAREAGWGEPLREQERYYNSGFVGLDIANRRFLDRWKAAVRLANDNGVAPGQFQKGGRHQVFFTVDQDTLNIATMYADVPFSTIGPEGMGFISGGFTMYHSVGKAKAWRKKYLRSLLKGVPPSNGDKHFIACAGGPLRPYSAAAFRSLRLRAGIAAFLGRFYRRA